MKLKELQHLERKKTREAGGYLEVSEFDHWQNKISRAKIRAFKRHHGACFLGRINRYGSERETPYVFKEYKRGMVYNFEFSFAVPMKDQNLLALIIERERAPYTGTKADTARIDNIFVRIEQLDGIYLRWV